MLLFFCFDDAIIMRKGVTIMFIKITTIEPSSDLIINISQIVSLDKGNLSMSSGDKLFLSDDSLKELTENILMMRNLQNLIYTSEKKMKIYHLI